MCLVTIDYQIETTRDCFERPEMRLIPLITAILVSLGLYFLVIQRETLLAFARVKILNPHPGQSLLTQVTPQARALPP